MNKLLVTLYIPTLVMEFDAYIPINKKVGTVKKYLLDIVNDISDNSFTVSPDKIKLIDHETGIEFDNNIFIKNAKIQNGSKLIIL